MLEFKVKSLEAKVGKLKGKTVYVAEPKGQQKLTPEMVLERIVRETSLSEGDARNVFITLRNLIMECARLGVGLDLGDIFSLRVVVRSKQIEKEIDVTADALKAPKLVLTWKDPIRRALKQLQVEVDNPRRKEEKKKKKKEEGGIGQHGN